MADAAENQAAGADAPDPDVYLGLTWREDPVGLPQLYGESDVTPARYLIDLRAAESSEGRCLLRLLLSDEAAVDLAEDWVPNFDLGAFATLESAIDAAELHDFHAFCQKVMSEAGDPIFRGSRRGAAVDGDELAVLLAHAGPAIGRETQTSPDGRPFTRAASFFRATKAALKQERDGSLSTTLKTAPGDLPLWLSEAAMGTIVLLGAVHLGEEADPDGAEERKRIKSTIYRASIRPGEGPFQEFMMKYDRWGLIRTAMKRDSDAIEAATEETLRRVVGIPSRGDLETSRDARERFDRLDREYYEDMARSVRRNEELHDR